MSESTKKRDDTNPELEDGEIAEDEHQTMGDSSQEPQDTNDSSSIESEKWLLVDSVDDESEDNINSSNTGTHSSSTQRGRRRNSSRSLSWSKRHRNARLRKKNFQYKDLAGIRGRKPRISNRYGRNIDQETGGSEISRQANSGFESGGYSQQSLFPQVSASANANDGSFQEIIGQYIRNARQRIEGLPNRQATESVELNHFDSSYSCYNNNMEPPVVEGSEWLLTEQNENISEAVALMPQEFQNEYLLLQDQIHRREHNRQLHITISWYMAERDEAQRKVKELEMEIDDIASHVMETSDTAMIEDLQQQLLKLLRQRKRNLEIVELCGKNLEICQRGFKAILPIEVLLKTPRLAERRSTN